ncbi:TPA: hypothetical protein ACRL4E_001923 [Pseudomonas aeruginosa]|uniref:hypothetical protein n=1 Tax=Pseudomonas nitroreducens TaxID=46680 RepID=UPI002F350CE8
MSFSEWMSMIALAVSLCALYFTFKKDAHRIRLRLKKGSYGTSDFISVNNDSSFPVHISSVGHLPLGGKVEWLEKIGDGKSNARVDFPVMVEPRTTYQGILVGDYPFKSDRYAYCVQLDCGRTFVISDTFPRKEYFYLKMRSLLSWVSSGKHGFEKNDIHMAKYK